MKQRIQYRESTWTLDTSKSKFSVYDGEWRDLTIREKEMLQGFPDWGSTHKQIGNAVTVPLISSLISSIVSK